MTTTTTDPTAIAGTDTINITDTINTIVARYPAALPLLQRFGLDTCCGGSLPLATAAAHHELDVQVVLTALEAVRAEQEASQ